ncbi:MAG: filamentous hemagglutinin family protein [Verrucomicrobia bacterium]|nr:filamentous hemagglutinin family protein [Verrucomicrobiota bacterium]
MPAPLDRPGGRLRRGISLTLVLALAWPLRAGDLLRGGAGAGGAAPAPPANQPSAGPTVQTATLPRAQDSLARTTQALAAVRAMQSEARNVAVAGPNNLGLNPNRAGAQLPNVVNGLGLNGLQPAPAVPRNLEQPVAGENPVLWQGARLPVQTAASGRTTVTIRQTEPQALLTWSNFNVGKETTLSFDQSLGGAGQVQWVAFNRVLDPSGAPSQILGSIQAGGQVYVLNQNGVIFGGSSQVRVHSLLASSLPLNDNLVSRGLLNNPDLQFLFSQLSVPALASGTMPAFTPTAPGTPTGRNGDIVVQPGAQLTSPTSADGVGGRIALIGPNVRNAGSISTPDGQTILAAGLQVGFAAHPAADPSLRGLDTFVGAVDEFSGSVTNSGLIEVARGNLTMAGANVSQLGAVASSTSVSLNGRIDLIASFASVRSVSNGLLALTPTRTGTVTLGPASVTQILPELASTERVVGTRLALSSLVNVQGQAIYLAPDSTLLAPSANLPADSRRPALGLDGAPLEAGVSLGAGTWLNNAAGLPAFVRNGGQIYLDRGAVIDVAGTRGAAASVTDNIVTAELRGAELADSPLQRDGALRGQSVQIDIRQTGTYNGQAWIGTPLGNVSGYANLVQRTVGVLTTPGGSIALNAGDSVVVQPGAALDVSGGSTDFAGGWVQTTKVISGGRIFDISQATPDRRYDGIYTGFNSFNERYGLTLTSGSTLITAPQFEAGYVQGASGGSLVIRTPGLALDGVLRGEVTVGPRQATTAPTPSRLSLVLQGVSSAAPFRIVPPAIAPTVEIRAGLPQQQAEAFALGLDGRPQGLRLDRLSRVVLDPALFGRSGFGSVSIDNSDGNVVVPAGATLTAQDGGALTLAAANVGVFGQLFAPGGSIAFTVTNLSPAGFLQLSSTQGASTPAPDPGRGTFTLGNEAIVSTAGRVVDRRGLGSDELATAVAGGSISLRAFNANLAAGGVLDVSGGVTVSGTGRIAYGAGGTLALAVGQDPNVASLLGGRLVLESTLRGYSGARGATLSILAPSLQLGGSARAGTLVLGPEFLTQGGFSRFNLGGLGDGVAPAVRVVEGTILRPSTESLLAELEGSEIRLRRVRQPEGVRAPASLALNAPGVTDTFNPAIRLVRGDIVFAAGASVLTDAGASVSLSADTVALLGQIRAPGGGISVEGSSNAALAFENTSVALPTVHLGPQSLLSAAGAIVLTPQTPGYRTGSVLPGGTIRVSGNLVAEAGSLLDVSGTSGTLDLAPGFSGRSLTNAPTGLQLLPTRVESNGGTITLVGGQELFVDATLRGQSGGPTALGGTLNVSSGRLQALNAAPLTPLEVRLEITAAGPTIPTSFYPVGGNAIDRPVLGLDGRPLGSFGHISAETLGQGGFGAISLGGTIGFRGPVALAAGRSLTLGASGIVQADAAVTLEAPYLRLGQAFRGPLTPTQLQNEQSVFNVDGAPFFAPPTFGAGSLSLRGQLVDLGNVSLQQIGQLSVFAPGGDVRGDGTVAVRGQLAIEAGQIYPTTGTRLTLTAYDSIAGGNSVLGSIRVLQSGTRSLPYSAAGRLTLAATLLDLDGTLRAPFGQIEVGVAANPERRDLLTGLALPVTRTLTLGARSSLSVSGLDPLTGEALRLPYGTVLNGISWLDPAGTDITVAGAPERNISIAGLNVTQLPGATVDLRGGGDLYAYRWVPGNGGSRDVLAAPGSFAVLPSYQAAYAPLDPNYAGAAAPGERVWLEGGAGLPPGFYTVLPARYALLEGAFLVTPKTSDPTAASLQPDGAALVSGYRFNAFESGQTGSPLRSAFEVAPAKVVRSRSEYVDSFANAFFTASAASRDTPPNRLPRDSGRLAFAALQSLRIEGTLRAAAPEGARGGLVDIASPTEIFIGTDRAAAPTGALFLDAAMLSAFGAESLLIGGSRSSAGTNSAVQVLSRSVTVDNATAPLSGTDLILVAGRTLDLRPGSQVRSSGGSSAGLDPLVFGDAAVPGSGEGALVRVSASGAPAVTRFGLDSSNSAVRLQIGRGAQLEGNALVVDSTGATVLADDARLRGANSLLSSSRISLALAAAELSPNAGLVLSASLLAGLQNGATSLSLLSYSSIDLYGGGILGNASLGRLSLSTAQIRGFVPQGETAVLSAGEIVLTNATGRSPQTEAISAGAGALELRASLLRLGEAESAGTSESLLRFDQFGSIRLAASNAIVAGRNQTILAQGDLTLATPVLVSTTAGRTRLEASGNLAVVGAAAGGSPVTPGLGGRLALQGAAVALGASIDLPSGAFSARATTGDLRVTGSLSVAGVTRTLNDVSSATPAGQITLEAAEGSVLLQSGASISVSAAQPDALAGTLSVAAPRGRFALEGALLGTGRGAEFSLDVGSLASTFALDRSLNDGGFREQRSLRIRQGGLTLDGLALSRNYLVSVDQGPLVVSGRVDASGATGGRIDLSAGGDLTLLSGAELSAAGAAFDRASLGGTISLATRTGQIDLRAGAILDLRVGEGMGGDLHLRAPRLESPAGVAVAPLSAAVRGARSVVVEGFSVLDAASVTPAALEPLQPAAWAAANTFMAGEADLRARLLADQPGLSGVLHLRPGIEIVNSLGDLVLNADWDFSTWRFGVRQAVVDALGNPLSNRAGVPILAGAEPGVLTLRAAGNLVLLGSLTDGFGTGGGAIDIPNDLGVPSARWREELLPLFANGSAQASWSFRLTAGADLTAADVQRVRPLAALSEGSGSLQLGRDGGQNVSFQPGRNAVAGPVINGRFQVIRTGAGAIDIAAGRDVQLLNPFATIYTAGARTPDPRLGGTFDTPILNAAGGTAQLGAVQQSPVYAAQFSQGGGNVSVRAQGDIVHLTRDQNGRLVDDSQRELPTNWLYRRGFVDPATGRFGVGRFGDLASTAWWVDFSNFFQGVGALGGGNVSLTAGRDIRNVDAVIPTNGRLPGRTASGLAADPTGVALVELGGGDLAVRAGRNLDAGIYYVERGEATLFAGADITTNATRTPSLGRIRGFEGDVFEARTWLPTTLFAGRSTFEVIAGGDLLLGPVANPFLLPSGYSNTYWYKTYFSTFSEASAVRATSIAGDVTLRASVTLPTEGLGSPVPILRAWYENVLLLPANAAQTAATYQPWLRLAETSVVPFATAFTLQPATLRVQAFEGDVNLVGNVNLRPASAGSVDLLAAGSIQALQPAGVTTFGGTEAVSWIAGRINLSDASPAALPSVTTPLAVQSLVGATPAATQTRDVFGGFNALFAETGATSGAQSVAQVRQALHADPILHADDREPVRLYAGSGSISGLTLYSPKATRIVAGRDVIDVAFYLQNVRAEDVSVVAAGRDVVAFSENSPLRTLAQSSGNALASGEAALAGDLQIGGPGSLQVLAGRNLDLGIGPARGDGTGLGLTSIGNARNPALPFAGASIFAGAGLGPVASLAASSLDFTKFEERFLDPTTAGAGAERYLPGLRQPLGLDEQASLELVLATYRALPVDRRRELALGIFYRVLRDSARDRVDPNSPAFGTYRAADTALEALFPGKSWQGSISLTSRQIKTTSGGDIRLFAPGGGLLVGFDLAGAQAADQGILTQSGGEIAIFTRDSVTVGTSRIFTLRGGDIVIWSSLGDIAAGASSKTVQAAPPTRVLVDPQSADVQTDLAGLATGGGIGVLATVRGVRPGDVDLIAPSGTVDAGDAGIRVSGNLNISAVQVVNAGNISAGGTSTGTPTVSAPNLGGLTSASTASAGATSGAAEAARQNPPGSANPATQDLPSIITVEVLGYGGGGEESGEDERRRQQAEASANVAERVRS